MCREGAQRAGGINRAIVRGGSGCLLLGGLDTRVALALHYLAGLAIIKTRCPLAFIGASSNADLRFRQTPVIPSVVVAVVCTSSALDSSTSTLPLPYKWVVCSITPSSSLLPLVTQRLITQQTDSDSYRPRESVSRQLPMSLFVCCDRLHGW